MTFLIDFGERIIGYGERQAVKNLERLYGKQTPRTAQNGTRGFQKVVNGETITTCVDSNFNVTAQVKHKKDIINSSAVKVKKNVDGDIVEVTHSRSATNFRKTVTENLETGEVRVNIFDCNPKNYFVTHTYVDKSGNITQKTRNVKVKGKESPLDK